MLAEYVRFPLMTGDDLEEHVLGAPEMDSPECARLVKEAAWFRFVSEFVFRLSNMFSRVDLFSRSTIFRSYSLVRQLRLMNEMAHIHRRFWQRKWNRHSVGNVYFDIHLEKFKALAINQTVESATFGIGGKRFYLSARHGRKEDATETLDIHLHLDNSQNVHPEIQVQFCFSCAFCVSLLSFGTISTHFLLTISG